MERREFLMLAHPAKGNEDFTGWYASEKLDGNRAFWDGGVTRGMSTELVPWASVLHPKTLQRKDKIKPISTGLWSRYGVPIIAPDWFLDKLPPIPLDGEVFAGRGKFQLTTSIVKGDTADKRWDQIQFCVFGSPSIDQLFRTGQIKNANMFCDLSHEVCVEFLRQRLSHYKSKTPDPRAAIDYDFGDFDSFHSLVGCDSGWARIDFQGRTLFNAIPFQTNFDAELAFIRAYTKGNKVVRVLQQRKVESQAMLDKMLDEILQEGGEGVILRNPAEHWVPKRTHGLKKLKPFSDAEARVIGFTAGRGKYEGKIGALITDFEGKRLELSGMTDEERSLIKTVGEVVPGKDLDPGSKALHFRIGDTVTFKYRELTDGGVPKEARFWRKRNA
jgi:hypothetical protein